MLAGLIRDRIGCTAYEITAAQLYPDSYDQTVQRNVQEERDSARPAIARALPDLRGYGIVLLASPVWNVRAPMIMSTFIEAVDLSGKTVLPVVTYAVSGIGNVERNYREALPNSRVGTGLAVRGEPSTTPAQTSTTGYAAHNSPDTPSRQSNPTPCIGVVNRCTRRRDQSRRTSRLRMTPRTRVDHRDRTGGAGRVADHRTVSALVQRVAVRRWSLRY